METDYSPKTTQHGFENKIFHTDIRVQSVDIDTAPHDGGAATNATPESFKSENDEAQKRASEMQLWWDEAIARKMNIPDGYHNVAVLLVKWADNLDELGTREETEELRDIFKYQFHYETQIVELNVASKPQHQLNRHLSAFVEKHDGPHNLMIVYYTGHGIYREDGKYLQLSASDIPIAPSAQRGLVKEACANWNKAEEVLRDDEVEGDVLTILDTCFSSNLAKSGREDVRTYELLSACGFDSITEGPGENSFTRALIDALKELLEKYKDGSFTTFHLNQQILLNPARRSTPSQLWYRLRHHERHIRLAPLQPAQNRLRKPSLPRPPRGYLTLRFALRDDTLNQQQIEFLTQKLSDAFKNKALVGLHRIDWLGIKPARSTHFGRAALALYACAQWKKFLNKRRQEKKELWELQSEAATTPSSPTRKRRCEDSSEYPGPKRGLLVAARPHGSPPSPPVSESS